MWKLEFLIVAYLGFLMCGKLSGNKIGCEKKEVSVVSLEIAENFVKKAKGLFPNCTDIATNTSECGAKEKASAYLDMAIKLISDAKEKYPTCNGTNPEEPEDPMKYPKNRDCTEVLQNGQKVSGVYTIWPNSSLFPNRSLEVFCDMDTDGGGWTVVQRRGNYVPQEDFYRNWNDYKNGFGNITKDFWIGNDNLFVLSNQGKYKIRFDLESAQGEKAYALYDSFFIKDENSHFELHIKYSAGSAGDSMTRHNGRSFYTKDQDNVGNCAKSRKGGWWYADCTDSNLNGEYLPGATGDYNYITWYSWKSAFIGLAASEMKIKAIVN